MASNIVKKSFTFDEFIVETQKELPADYHDNYFESSKTGSRDFTGTKSFAEATEYLKYGWPEGVTELKTELDNLKPATAPALECIFDVAGEEPDIGRFLSGEPENMVEYQTVNRDGIKFVDVYVCYSYNCSWSTRDVIKRGAAILSNIDGLEANGYRCRIIGYQSAQYNRRRKKTGLQVTVLLKDYNEALELDRMAFCLVSPSMYRRMGFKLDELHQPSMSNHSYGFDLSYTVPKDSNASIQIDRSMFAPRDINREFMNYLNSTE